MGANAGIIKNINRKKLRDALFGTMPATMSMETDGGDPRERDVKRAQILQMALAEGE